MGARLCLGSDRDGMLILPLSVGIGSAQVPARVETPYTLIDAESRTFTQAGVETPVRGNGPLTGYGYLFLTRPHFLDKDLYADASTRRQEGWPDILSRSTPTGAALPRQWRRCPTQSDPGPANIVTFLQIGLAPRLHRTTSATRLQRDSKWRAAMLWTIAVILLVLWALGMLTSYTLGGVVHALLVIALVVIAFQFISGRRSI
jgi:Family of unknown function (DUF5670)